MKYITKIYQHFANDSLYRNSIYLMLSTGVMAFFGFFFWMINTRLFTTEQIGLATTIISVVGLITSFSLLGLDVGLIRYLPKSERKNDKINTSFFAVVIITTILAILFLVGLKIFSPKLLFIKENSFYSFLLILFIVFSSANVLIESIFIAFRNTKFILIKNTIFSVLKLILPFFLVGLGTYGIFGSWMVALTIAFIVSFIILVTKFGYKPQLILRKSVIGEIGRYSFGNYIAGFFGGLPILVLPLMITNIINPETTAHYYMAMMIASLLFVVPGSITQSLFAEGSHGETEFKEHIIKAIKIILLILIPAIIVIILFGNYILLAFGKNYSTEGFRFLQILALSGIFVSINSIFGTILRVKREIKRIIFIGLFESLLILGLSYLLISKGLLGIGIAWIIGQSAVSLVYLAYEGWSKIVNFFIYLIHENGIPFIHKKQIWSIGIYTGKSPLHFALPENIKNPVLTAKDVTDVPTEFVADPFMIKENSIWYMFFEVMNIHTKRGEIGVATSSNGFSWKYKQIVLTESFHLSYPYVFKWQNDYYMIPESYEANSIRLYKAVNFPTQWSFIEILLEGSDYADPSIFCWHERWWLFASSTESNILRLYFADSPLGPWIEHPQSPIVTNNACMSRPAGRVTLFNDCMIRFTQDDTAFYGNQVMAFEITKLTTTSYKEKETKGNPVLQANGISWNAKGMHHIDPHQIGENKWIACVDGHVEILRFEFNF
jgi:O-antigen/teichoic acid export membrane protein